MSERWSDEVVHIGATRHQERKREKTELPRLSEKLFAYLWYYLIFKQDLKAVT